VDDQSDAAARSPVVPVRAVRIEVLGELLITK
jgi:hypothetical protein